MTMAAAVAGRGARNSARPNGIMYWGPWAGPIWGRYVPLLRGPRAYGLLTPQIRAETPCCTAGDRLLDQPIVSARRPFHGRRLGGWQLGCSVYDLPACVRSTPTPASASWSWPAVEKQGSGPA